MTLCEMCEKPLVAIAASRKNGKELYEDWGSRKMHKKCYKIFKMREEQKRIQKVCNEEMISSLLEKIENNITGQEKWSFIKR